MATVAGKRNSLFKSQDSRNHTMTHRSNSVGKDAASGTEALVCNDSQTRTRTPEVRRPCTNRSDLGQMSGISTHTEAVSESGLTDKVEPVWQQLTEKARTPLGQEKSPVYKWHNDYVEIRQRGRKQMQV